ncbi:uncharacterized protein [Cicer arietinum]|uniref:Pentatricopeptide repeat-containing protein At1g16830 n=1 Tax=Cicer arietinum TaxID=3827 RepID=A0A1S3EG23_CICAR|nr:putative pentatricopeptide repeat-containing protein At1g16830 [Cicer arietinum]XP_012574784.1 putative pentatricopeptide repeat-containing protein At1g16830 [Cicer arietinum]XP_012574785.1 putative pentatricopeptide repeat-containing protein At1g16830 [Cicer arietinum]XP_012574786.1 putative pentatricopeptide repeat-containing protein At1g16830 [Cicer arietinum]XP_012574787.1 putative pentatricopeptide repeat-containing protein At1g16830 [Cicer arietinum]XP_027193266.1 putative pentatricop
MSTIPLLYSMNTNLSKALQPQYHFLTTSIKMITTQTHSLQIPIYKRKNNNTDLITLSIFLWSSKHRHHHSPDFDRIIPVLHRLTYRYKTPQTILSNLKSIGSLNFPKNNINPNPFLLFLRIIHRAGNHNMLIDTFDHMVQSHGFVPDTFACNLLMDSLFRTSRSQIAFSVFKHTNSPNFFTFNIAIFHLSNLNYFTDVVNVLRQMLRTGYYPNVVTFNAILNSFCKVNALSQAYQLLGLMVGLGIELSVNVWTVIIHTCCKLRRLNVAIDLFYNMIRTGCSPSVVTYTALIKAFMESNMVNDALHLLNDMLSDGLVPDLVLYNVLIDCLSKVGRYEDAIQAFLCLSEQKNIKPDSCTFTSLLSTICLSRRFCLLPKIVQVCRHMDSDLVFCNALLSSYVKAGCPSRALGLYKHMIDEGLKPDKYSVVGLLSALCAKKRINEAVNVYRGVVMKADAHIHTVITTELIKTGKYHMAAGLFRLAAIKKYPLDSVAFAVVISALLRSGQTLEAKVLYDQMKDNGLEPNAQIFNMMLFCWCKEKDLQMIKQLLKEMIDSRIELSDRNFFNLCKFPCSLYFLAEMRDLGLLSAKILHSLSFDRHAESVKEKYKYCAEVDKEWNQVLDSSSSEDMSDVAVSVC